MVQSCLYQGIMESNVGQRDSAAAPHQLQSLSAASLATARAAAGSASIATVMSLAATQFAALPATLAPSPSSSLHLSGDRFQTVTV